MIWFDQIFRNPDDFALILIHQRKHRMHMCQFLLPDVMDPKIAVAKIAVIAFSMSRNINRFVSSRKSFDIDHVLRNDPA